MMYRNEEMVVCDSELEKKAFGDIKKILLETTFATDGFPPCPVGANGWKASDEDIENMIQVYGDPLADSSTVVEKEDGDESIGD